MYYHSRNTKPSKDAEDEPPSPSARGDTLTPTATIINPNDKVCSCFAPSWTHNARCLYVTACCLCVHGVYLWGGLYLSHVLFFIPVSPLCTSLHSPTADLGSSGGSWTLAAGRATWMWTGTA